MILYRTNNGTWGGTQAEMPALCREDGSPQGGWKQVAVPTDKKNLLAFLNHSRSAPPTPVAAPPATRERKPPPRGTGSNRYRVHAQTATGEWQFVSAAFGNSEEEACAQIATRLRAREV